MRRAKAPTEPDAASPEVFTMSPVRSVHFVPVWTEFPRIRQMAREAGAAIWFSDECGVRSDYHTGATWGRKGSTPVVKSTGARFRFNLVSAINNLGQMRFMLTDQNVNTEVSVEFLRRLLTGTTQPVFLVVDGHPVHRSRAVKRFVLSTKGRLRLFFVPPYSPEVKPDEQVWNAVKNKRVGHAAPRSKAELKSLLVSAPFALQKLPRIIKSLEVAVLRNNSTGPAY